MPAPYGRRDWQTRADRALGRMGRGSQQGRFPGTRPVFPHSTLGRPVDQVDYRDVESDRWIDTWSVTTTTDSTFTTSFPPLLNSWNLMLDGLRVHESEFSVSNYTVTVADPADLFKGVTTQGSPWSLEMQYDYALVSTTSPLDLAVVGKPWFQHPPATTTNRYVWFNLQGFSGGDPAEVSVQFYDSTNGLQNDIMTTGPDLYGAPFGATIWYAHQIRPWYDTVAPEGVRITVLGSMLHDYTDAIHTSAASPPTDYDGTGI